MLTIVLLFLCPLHPSEHKLIYDRIILYCFYRLAKEWQAASTWKSFTFIIEKCCWWSCCIPGGSIFHASLGGPIVCPISTSERTNRVAIITERQCKWQQTKLLNTDSLLVSFCTCCALYSLYFMAVRLTDSNNKEPAFHETATSVGEECCFVSLFQGNWM